MIANQVAQDAIAQNLANASTTGYKQDIPRISAFNDQLVQRMVNGNGPNVGDLGRGSLVNELSTDFSGGSLQKSGNALDVALTGNAFLAVQTPQGVRYSRDGALGLNAQGELVQMGSGAPVLDRSNQSIRIPANAKQVTITAQGEIFADNARVATLNLVGIDRNAGARKIGENLYTATNVQPLDEKAGVRQGYLETSNVSVVKEMVRMIATMRAYETNQKMIQVEDEATGKAVNDVAKL